MALKRLISNLYPDLWEKMENANILTAQDVFSKSELELLNVLSILPSQVKIIHSCIFQLCSVPRTAIELKKSKGNRVLNLFHGREVSLNLPVASIIEFAGDSAVGKSQAVMQLSLQVAMRSPLGWDCGVVYFDSDNSFSAQRFVIFFWRF